MDSRIDVVIGLMKAKIAEPLSSEELARAVNLSTSRLRHLFKSETGVSLKQYQKSLRMQLAQTLLARSFLTVKEITIRVGMRDPGRFVRDFKVACGLTPTQYRKLHRKIAKPATE
jgi:AraC family transcriptional regulator, arabinose operon regulatory protein